MSEVKDSAIKLFGKTIPFSVVNYQKQQQQKPPLLLATYASTTTTAKSSSLNDNCCDRSPEEDTSDTHQQQDKEHSRKEINEKDDSRQIVEDRKDPTTSSGISDNPETPSVDTEAASSLKSSKKGEQQSETSNSDEKTLKKPDKILPCPRCNSMETKFCYYNNYNVNQPRHFCKNCQRYWTAGGTMRNVPVGAGRRKNKGSSASQHYRQIMISEALRAAHNPSYGNNGTVLNFGSDSPLCETVSSVLKLSDKTQNGVRNGFHGSEDRILVSRGVIDNGDEHSNGSSSITALNSSEKVVNCGSASGPQVQYFPGPPWPFPWNSPMPPPALCPPGFPVSIYPEAAYWGCTIPGQWNIPCLSPTYSSLSPTTSTLGKHSRDGNIISPAISDKEELSRGAQRSVLVPKTLRIDDPSEAAKSSIWATLGIKSEKTTTGEGLFKGFQSKSGDKNYIAETSVVLQANPAAFFRSRNFHEST
ncbi:hypothetical protein EZV62_017828 [Acer yangbiense]|uniref:Dof-type domain-containing protein n=1 Tax=Acer yangbiense TaxID=1000413 RepID=A0A5C7HIC8_9ROSI|nr:hypothetical protein EZV62_017828 [Acer yangbiense]